MTIFTHRSDGRRCARRGFTLTEVMLAATLSVFTMAGVLSTFLFIGRTSINSSNYSAMEAEIRRGLDAFSTDVRCATAVRWDGPQRLTLTLPDHASDGPGPVTYSFVRDEGSSLGSFTRQVGSGVPRVLVTNVAADFAFQRYKLEQAGVSDHTARNDLETKQLQLTLRTLRLSTTGPAASQTVVSTRYVLRNKSVSQ